MESGLISFFEIRECGFYRIKQGKNELATGGVADSLHSIRSWLKDKELENTLPWDKNSNISKTKIYCESSSFNKVTNDFLFVFWKDVGDDDGNVKGLLAKGAVSQSTTKAIKINKQSGGNDYIYGNPMYYWFIPEYNLIASIRLPNSLASLDSALDYIKKCTDYRIPRSHRKVSTNVHFNHFANKNIEAKSVNYRSEDDSYSMKFKITAHTKELSAYKVDAQNLAKKITHLVIRDTISTTRNEDKGMDSSIKLWNRIRGVQTRHRMTKEVELIEDANLSAEELLGIISVYQQDIKSGGWNNIGFKTEGIKSTTKWFGKYVERQHITLSPDQKQEDVYYPANIVLQKLTDKRSQILSSYVKEQRILEAKAS